MSRVPMVRPMSRRDIDDHADRQRRRFRERMRQFDSPQFDVVGLFEMLDDFDERLSPEVDELEEGTEGRALPDGRIIVDEDTFNAACGGDGRARFTVAHECAHGLLHVHQVRRQLDDGNRPLYRRRQLPAYCDPEWQANRWAASLLMPERMVRDVTSPSDMWGTSIVADEFGVSYTAAAIRLRDIFSRK